MTTLTSEAGRGVVLLVAALAWHGAAPIDSTATAIVGTQFDYTVVTGDSWQSIGSRHGIDAAVLARSNSRSAKERLHAGDLLHVDARHLVPEGLAAGIVINIPQRMLMLMQEAGVVAAYPVGLGRADWPTFVGPFTVVARERDPVWDVPPSIQEELRRAGKTVVTRVPPGPTNPLGRFWLGLSEPNFGIHGTLAPRSIFRFESHGCIRLHPDDIADLWARIDVGTPGVIAYEPIILRTLDDRLALEAHPDVYRLAGDPLAFVESAVAAGGLGGRIDWALVRLVLNARDGRPHLVEVTRSLPHPLGMTEPAPKGATRSRS
jgi:L,D-transpeptidase ErfK/SrfK